MFRLLVKGGICPLVPRNSSTEESIEGITGLEAIKACKYATTCLLSCFTAVVMSDAVRSLGK